MNRYGGNAGGPGHGQGQGVGPGRGSYFATKGQEAAYKRLMNQVRFPTESSADSGNVYAHLD
eukprot:COSAG04_NODE_636_length_11710_cov_63.646973_1_plen_62_part_00